MEQNQSCFREHYVLFAARGAIIVKRFPVVRSVNWRPPGAKNLLAIIDFG
jgi:hypothetical protein